MSANAVSAADNLKDLERTAAARWRAAFPGHALGLFHLARVEERLCLFHANGLAEREPAAWMRLQQVALDLGAELRVDRRARATAVAHERRRLVAAAAVTAQLIGRVPLAAAGDTIGLAAVTGRVAETAPVSETHRLAIESSDLPGPVLAPANRMAYRDANGRMRIGSGQLDAARRVDDIARLSDCSGVRAAASSPCIVPNSAAAAAITADLKARLDGTLTPALARQMSEIADYYSQYPEVVELFDALRPHPYTLRPEDGQWLTVSQLADGSVTQVSVRFDLRTAALMHGANGCADQPACTTMPADALLHELLHVYLMRVRQDEFVRLMRDPRGPQLHEQEVIGLEYRLYRAMEARDALPRPARTGHEGHLVAVDCPLCWRLMAATQ